MRVGIDGTATDESKLKSRVTSSAKSRMSSPIPGGRGRDLDRKILMAESRARIKRKGPITLPCGTPFAMSREAEMPSRVILIERSSK